MSCNSYNFHITKGCSFLVYLNVTNSDGSYVNLSGYTSRGLVKNMPGDTGYIFDLNPLPTEPLVSGTIMISGSATGTRYIPDGSFIYDIEIISSDNNYALKVLNGDFKVSPSTSF